MITSGFYVMYNDTEVIYITGTATGNAYVRDWPYKGKDTNWNKLNWMCVPGKSEISCDSSCLYYATYADFLIGYQNGDHSWNMPAP